MKKGGISEGVMFVIPRRVSWEDKSRKYCGPEESAKTLQAFRDTRLQKGSWDTDKTENHTPKKSDTTTDEQSELTDRPNRWTWQTC